MDVDSNHSANSGTDLEAANADDHTENHNHKDIDFNLHLGDINKEESTDANEDVENLASDAEAEDYNDIMEHHIGICSIHHNICGSHNPRQGRSPQVLV